MSKPDGFQEALAMKLAAILPDADSQTAAAVLLTKHLDAVRRICTSTARMGVRVAKLAKADDELLDALDALNPTDEPDAEPEVTGTA